MPKPVPARHLAIIRRVCSWNSGPTPVSVLDLTHRRAPIIQCIRDATQISSMASGSNWRQQIRFSDRYDNVDEVRKSIERKGPSAAGTAHKAAYAAETEAYNASDSRDAYDAACKALVDGPAGPRHEPEPVPDSPGVTIGDYQNCQHVASGIAAEVYKSGVLALKVATQTIDIEPHNPAREAKVLSELSHSSIIRLHNTFRDNANRLTLVFPFMPLTLAKVLDAGALSGELVRTCFQDLFAALAYIHEKGIIHRDVKPSNLLLASATGPAYLSDFGTTWHPSFSTSDEPADHKVLEVGTTCYRAPEALFGNRAYDSSLDMWAAGTMLVECLRDPPKPLFESRDSSADGNQLGLILSIFKTLGTPTRESWPEAVNFSTPPFDWYQIFPGSPWEGLLPETHDGGRDLATKLVRYESTRRLTARKALSHPYFQNSNPVDVIEQRR